MTIRAQDPQKPFKAIEISKKTEKNYQSKAEETAAKARLKEAEAEQKLFEKCMGIFDTKKEEYINLAKKNGEKDMYGNIEYKSFWNQQFLTINKYYNKNNPIAKLRDFDLLSRNETKFYENGCILYTKIYNEKKVFQMELDPERQYLFVDTDGDGPEEFKPIHFNKYSEK